MVRGQMNFKRLTLTDITIDISRVPKNKWVDRSYGEDVKNKWESSSWGRKLIVQKRRASLNDFDRFKLMLAKIKGMGKRWSRAGGFDELVADAQGVSGASGG
ncbi:60S ribosomal protein L14-2 [Gossypium hirsutum]|uniref:60S ribosomal protein L14-2 n=1 Tax=Gossypium hirsutum TaxID=3635 RepID=A0ABM2YQH8_GOSHI|nr:60S ribosomal protein L14-2-like [Gossypium hirsutum]